MAKIHTMVIDFVGDVAIREMSLSSELRIIDDAIDLYISDKLSKPLAEILPERFNSYRNQTHFVFPWLCYIDESC